ncbi:MAG TPA: tetratricopeptide repeat protein [Hyphomicrobiaceae bacterium]|nr:tetratricopeptide repeat protein [Hyphomicrobiaceae bacterium]
MSSQKSSKWGASKWDVVKAAGALVAKPQDAQATQKVPMQAGPPAEPAKAPPAAKPRVSVVQPHARYHTSRSSGGAERAATDRDARIGRSVVAFVLGLAILIFGSNYAGLWESPGQTAARQQAERKSYRPERPPMQKAPAIPKLPEPQPRKAEKAGKSDAEREAQLKLALERASKRIRDEAERLKAKEEPQSAPPVPVAPPPTPAPERPNLAETDCQMSKPVSAIVPACSQIIARHGDYAEAYFIRAWALRERNQPERALTDFNRAIELEPKLRPAYYSQRGLTYVRLSDFDRALLDYNKAIELNPRSPTFHNDRGVAYLDLKDYAHALADFGRAIELDQRYAVPYNNRARAHVLSAGDHGRAIADLDKAIEINPTYALAFENRGLSHLELEDFVSAMADFDKAVELNPRSARAINARGVAHERQGSRDRAIADYRRALDTDATFTAARENLTRLGEKP